MLVVGALAGFLAAVVMNLPMGWLADGYAPAYVAAAAVRGRSPETVARRDAVVVHHAAGVLAGLVHAVLTWAVLSITGTADATAGVGPFANLAVAAVLVVCLYALFAYLVFPRAGGPLRERGDAIRRQWLLSAFVYGFALSALVPGLLAVA